MNDTRGSSADASSASASSRSRCCSCSRGVILAGKRGVLDVLGLVAPAQGIGLGVAAVSLALGHNPVDARRPDRRSE